MEQKAIYVEDKETIYSITRDGRVWSNYKKIM